MQIRKIKQPSYGPIPRKEQRNSSYYWQITWGKQTGL